MKTIIAFANTQGGPLIIGVNDVTREVYGLTLEEAISGRSKQRNRIVAEVFNQMGLIEAWGTGLRNIQ